MLKCLRNGDANVKKDIATKKQAGVSGCTEADLPLFTGRSRCLGRRGTNEGTGETDLFLHGPNCVDMNECITGDHDCDEFHGECINRFVKCSKKVYDS